MRYRFLKLLAVGGAAFVVDAGVLVGLIEVCRLAPVPSRLVSFAFALGFSYVLNRSITFADRPRLGVGQFFLYVVTSIVAGAMNIATFTVILRALAPLDYAPYVAMPAGVAVGLVINYTLYSRFVFLPSR